MMVGMVVKQALILARLLGWRIDMDDIQVSLVLKLGNCNINDGNTWYSLAKAMAFSSPF